jgi:hypothetical protein
MSVKVLNFVQLPNAEKTIYRIYLFAMISYGFYVIVKESLGIKHSYLKFINFCLNVT